MRGFGIGQVLVVLALSSGARAESRTARKAPASASPFGVASSGEAAGQYVAYLPKLAQIGVRSLRVFGEWGGLEPRERALDLTAEDARVDALRKRGIEPNGSFQYSPRWALPPGADAKTLPMGRLDAFGHYVAEVVAHYRGRIRYWEVWNEPNAPAFNHGAHAPADYARLVATAHAAAKAASPSALIGITCANVDVRYLKLVIEALAAQKTPGAFDFLAVHPYDLLAHVGRADGELAYLSIVDNLRKMLAEVAPARRKVPIRFTELGAPSEHFSEQEAAALLIKGYTLALAQGVEQVQWFEAKDAGGSRGFGLLREDLGERLTFRAYGAMTALLGAAPRYRGWLALDGGYGFVFANDQTSVMIAWMPQGKTASIALGGAVRLVDPATHARRALAADARLTLGAVPALIEDVPAALVQKAVDNRSKPYAWGRPAIDARHAAVTLGPDNDERGLTQPEREATEPVRLDDGSTGVRVNVGRGNALRVFVRPSFADYTTRVMYVRVTARTTAPLPHGRTAGMNLWYQPISGAIEAPPPYPYANTGRWWTVPDDQRWHRHTWQLSDATFVQSFGFGLYLQFDDSAPFVVGKVELSKVPFSDE